MIAVESKVPTYEINGEKTSAGNANPLVVRSHRIYQDQIVLAINGLEVTVTGADLERAIKNAMNTKAF